MGAFMPANTIAGRILIKPGYERDAVFHAAAALLDTEHIRFVMMVLKGYAWYLAAPSADFANDPNAMAPLASALPGHPGHKGDGAYVFQIVSGQILSVVKQGDALKTYYGTEQQVRRFIEMEGCTRTHVITDGGLPWQSFLAEQRREASKLARAVVGLGVVLTVMSSIVWLGAAVVAGRNEEEIHHLLAQHRHELSRSVTEMNARSRGDAAMREHARLVAEVLRYPNAQIKRFRFAGGRSSWLVYVPANAALEKFKELGANVDPAPREDGRVAVERREH